jgi:hypothetical protein
MKSAALERQLGDMDETRALLEQARARFPAFDKLWMMSGQLEEQAGDLAKARDHYTAGLKECPVRGLPCGSRAAGGFLSLSLSLSLSAWS